MTKLINPILLIEELRQAVNTSYVSPKGGARNAWADWCSMYRVTYSGALMPLTPFLVKIVSDLPGRFMDRFKEGIMQRRNHGNFLIVFCAFLVSCSYLIPPLSDADIDQYIRAYGYLAEISPALEKERANTKSLSIFICIKCLTILDDAVKKAGYSGFKSFLIMDIRIHYAMQSVLFLKISQLLGDTVTGTPDGPSIESACKSQSQQNSLDDSKKQDIEKLCKTASAVSRHVKKIASLVEGAADKLLQQGDVERVDKRFDDIFNAITNEKLIDELNHARTSKFDD